MALLTFLTPEQQQQTKQPNTPKRKHDVKQRKRKPQAAAQNQSQPKPAKPKPIKPPTSSWDSFKSLLTCKQVEGSAVHDPSKNGGGGPCGSICSFRDVVHGHTSRVVHRADNSPESSSLGQEARLLTKNKNGCSNSASGSASRSLAAAGSAARSHGASSYSGSSRGMQFRKLSGCYECHTIVDPSRYPLPRTTICACPDCGEVFPKIESLEHHQAVRHAVSELGPEDSSRNIVEIIFKSSWLKKDNPVCKIERILKVHNTQRTIQRFEDCRDAVKIRANVAGKKNPRCAADGNELLRFYCTTLTCALGARGSSSLCGSLPGCGVCAVIRHGFQGNKVAGGIRTTASSGRAHDCPHGGNDGRRAMLVCRVIAGRVRRVAEDNDAGNDENAPAGLSASLTASVGSYDSVAGYGGMYSNLEELYVFNPRAILPCFVVIYKAMES